MSRNTRSILLWDISDCPSKSTECISKISKLLKINFSSIICLAQQHSEFPPDMSDLGTLMPIVLRYGSHAIHDAIVDAVGSIAKAAKYNFVLISNDYGIWIDLFQRVPPVNLIFVSTNDPRQSLSFSFLPDSVKFNILQWPSLNELAGGVNGVEIIADDHIENKNNTNDKDDIDDDDDDDDDDDESQPQQELDDHKLEEEETYEQNSYTSPPKKNSPKVVFQQKTSPQADRIKPLSNLEKHQIDLRSPTGPTTKTSPTEKSEGRKNQSISKDQPTSFPLQFQPLIEAMKSIGKSMISLSDLEEQFNICCKNLNLPPQELMTMIEKASHYGLIIFDNSINYVRFKNRSLATTSITYI